MNDILEAATAINDHTRLTYAIESVKDNQLKTTGYTISSIVANNIQTKIQKIGRHGRPDQSVECDQSSKLQTGS